MTKDQESASVNSTYIQSGCGSVIFQCLRHRFPRHVEKWFLYKVLQVIVDLQRGLSSFSNMAATSHEVTPDALPYYDQGYEEPEVREMVRLFFFII